jgi:hypothetical protein
MSIRARHRGYVLIIALGLLVLASAALVNVGRAAIDHALAARQAQDELQRRWAVASCRNLLLASAEQLIAREEFRRRQPAPSHAMKFQLGALAMDVIVADEQAKANVNTLLEHANASQAQTRLRDALTGSGLSAKIHLRPLVPRPAPTSASQPTTDAAPAPVTQLIEGFGQVFDDVSASELLTARTAPSRLLTCWGGGLMNYRRATPAALKLALTDLLTAPELAKFVEARDTEWNQQTRTASRAATAPATQESSAAQRLLAQAGIDSSRTLPLTDTSTCYSVTIVVHDARRQWHYLFVRDTSPAAGGTTDRSFVW